MADPQWGHFFHQRVSEVNVNNPTPQVLHFFGSIESNTNPKLLDDFSEGRDYKSQPVLQPSLSPHTAKHPGCGATSQGEPVASHCEHRGPLPVREDYAASLESLEQTRCFDQAKFEKWFSQNRVPQIRWLKTSFSAFCDWFQTRTCRPSRRFFARVRRSRQFHP